MVVVGRPKGDRGSYRQWQEGNLAPQVVFEILSPGNRYGEMLRKLGFYNRHGVEEYYIYDPDKLELTGLLRGEQGLEVIEEINGWVSPRLQIRFQITGEGLEIYRPDGQRFLTYSELGLELEQARSRADQERSRAEQAQEQVDRLAAQLRAAGLEPNL
jgi:hypothetical protein